MILEVEVMCPTRSSADRIASALLKARLIGSASRGDTVLRLSHDGEDLTQSEEVVLRLRTLPELGDRVENAITEMHPHEVPMILRHSVWANASYTAWLALEVAGASRD